MLFAMTASNPTAITGRPFAPLEHRNTVALEQDKALAHLSVRPARARRRPPVLYRVKDRRTVSKGGTSLNRTESTFTAGDVDDEVSFTTMHPTVGELSDPTASTVNTPFVPVGTTCEVLIGSEHPNGRDSTRMGASTMAAPSGVRRLPVTTTTEAYSKIGGKPVGVSGDAGRWQPPPTAVAIRAATMPWRRAECITERRAMTGTHARSTRLIPRRDGHSRLGSGRWETSRYSAHSPALATVRGRVAAFP